jgi:lysophospholipid acyltransferase (LPLAT)-like uncharacterized protein
VHWISEGELPDKAILVLWHEHLPICIRAFAHRGISVLISKSADGEWAAQACARFGYQVHRGSTSNGGLAGMRALARSLETGCGSVGMVLDGPRGPRGQTKPGTAWLSGITGIPVVPISVHAKMAFRLKSWDRCLVPLPFSAVEIKIGIPFQPNEPKEIDQAMQDLAKPNSPRVIYIPTSQVA